MTKVLIYDLEIKNGFLDKNAGPIDGIAYCADREDFAGMGIAVLCAWVGWKQWPMVFFEENLDQFVEVAAEADVCAGFNNIGFDNRVLQAYGIEMIARNSYDILAEIVEVTGKRVKLDDVCSANFGINKSGDAAMAPILWQQGKKLDVVNYCLHDTVALTRRVLELIWRQGGIIHPYGHHWLPLRKPTETKEEFYLRRAA